VSYALQSILHLAQQLHVQGVSIQENPLFVTLLAQIALVVRVFLAREYLRRFLGGHAPSYLVGLLL
jgi:hypothetical protein